MQKKMPDYDNVHATIPMPGFSIIYVKKTERTPQSTTVTFTFPDGQTVDYKSKNVILEDFTKEKVAEKRLLQEKIIGLPLTRAKAYLDQYGKQPIQDFGIMNAVITHTLNEVQ